VQACRNSYTAVLKSLHAFDLITLGFSASVFNVSIAMARSSSWRPTDCRVLGSAPSGGGVMMALVLAFLAVPPSCCVCCFLLALDFVIVWCCAGLAVVDLVGRFFRRHKAARGGRMLRGQDFPSGGTQESAKHFQRSSLECSHLRPEVLHGTWQECRRATNPFQRSRSNSKTSSGRLAAFKRKSTPEGLSRLDRWPCPWKSFSS
jgi:hypothetical protein